jgi:SAM-dependent methyltransferase
MSLKSTLPHGVRQALAALRTEIWIWRQHRRAVYRARSIYANRTGLKLNVGCGQNYKHGWVNIDLARTADLVLDMREPIPLADGSVRMIYSEHFFEHLDYPQHAAHFLSESYRILEPGGVFSVGVPDTRWPSLTMRALVTVSTSALLRRRAGTRLGPKLTSIISIIIFARMANIDTLMISILYVWFYTRPALTP